MMNRVSFGTFWAMRKLSLILLLVSITYPLVGETSPEPHASRDASRALNLAEERQAELREARTRLQAVAAVFPDRVDQVAFRSGDWAILIEGDWFYWAGGRLLREGDRVRWREYSPVRFYSYYPGPARLRRLSPEREARLRGDLASIDARRPPRSPAFADALYGIRNRAEAESQMQEVSFLGLSTRIHRIAYDALKRVEARIVDRAATDAEVSTFVGSLRSVHGYNWRNIAGSGSRSYHSYGLAIDLVPRSYGNLPVYWRWAAEAGWREWWRIPVEERWAPPQAVVDAFEAEGFYWGGKWLFFDNLHFEYRPEVFAF